MRWHFALSVFLFLVMAGKPASAESFKFQWTVGEFVQPASPVWVDKGETIAETRLWPMELYFADSEVRAESGRLLFREGAQLIATDSYTIVVCNFDLSSDKAYRSSKKRICIVDEDRDDTFDAYFETSVQDAGFIKMNGRVKDRRRKITPTKLTRIDGQQMDNPPFMSLIFDRYRDAGNYAQTLRDHHLGTPAPRNVSHARFIVAAGREDRRTIVNVGCVGEAFRPLCVFGEFPQEHEFWGMKIRILERKGESLLLEYLTGFQPVPYLY